jgi:hypothetical protein
VRIPRVNKADKARQLNAGHLLPERNVALAQAAQMLPNNAHAHAPAEHGAPITHARRAQWLEHRRAGHASAGRVFTRAMKAWASGARRAVLESTLTIGFPETCTGVSRCVAFGFAQRLRHPGRSDFVAQYRD